MSSQKSIGFSFLPGLIVFIVTTSQILDDQDQTANLL